MLGYGGNLLRILKTLAVLMTVAGSVPQVRCVCPDGRVLLFCLTLSSSSNCCCVSAAIEFSGQTDSEMSHFTASDNQKPSCCSHPFRLSVQPSEKSPCVKTPCGCQHSVSSVAEAVVASATDLTDTILESNFAPIAWVLHPIVSGNAYFPGRASPRFLLPPPDLVVKFCHFSC